MVGPYGIRLLFYFSSISASLIFRCGVYFLLALWLWVNRALISSPAFNLCLLTLGWRSQVTKFVITYSKNDYLHLLGSQISWRIRHEIVPQEKWACTKIYYCADNFIGFRDCLKPIYKSTGLARSFFAGRGCSLQTFDFCSYPKRF